MLNAMKRAPIPEPLADNLWRVRQPVRLLVGSVRRHGGIETSEITVLRDRLRDFAADTVNGSGVYVHEERPDAVARSILALSDDVPPIAASALLSPAH